MWKVAVVAGLLAVSTMPIRAESAATQYWTCGVLAREKLLDQTASRNEVKRFFRLAQSKEPETLSELEVYLAEPGPDFWRGYELAAITGDLFIQIWSKVAPGFDALGPAEKQKEIMRVAQDLYDRLACKQLLELSGT
jgi:hypothetical protein